FTSMTNFIPPSIVCAPCILWHPFAALPLPLPLSLGHGKMTMPPRSVHQRSSSWLAGFSAVKNNAHQHLGAESAITEGRSQVENTATMNIISAMCHEDFSNSKL